MAFVKNEAVFVIYRNGKPYEHVKKPVYLTKGAANGQITQVVADEVQRIYEKKRKESGYKIQEWYWLTKEEQENHISEIRKEFDVIEYGPKGR